MVGALDRGGLPVKRGFRVEERLLTAAGLCVSTVRPSPCFEQYVLGSFRKKVKLSLDMFHAYRAQARMQGLSRFTRSADPFSSELSEVSCVTSSRYLGIGGMLNRSLQRGSFDAFLTQLIVMTELSSRSSVHCSSVNVIPCCCCCPILRN